MYYSCTTTREVIQEHRLILMQTKVKKVSVKRRNEKKTVVYKKIKIKYINKKNNQDH